MPILALLIVTRVGEGRQVACIARIGYIEVVIPLCRVHVLPSDRWDLEDLWDVFSSSSVYAACDVLIIG